MVALGNPIVGAPAVFGRPGLAGSAPGAGEPGLAGAAGLPASRTVGAGLPAGGGPAARTGIAGAGIGRPGTVGAVMIGGPPGIGGLTGGAMGTVAEGTEGGASAAFRVTRTVSFFKGTLDVCLEGAGGRFSLSLMRWQVFSCLGAQ